MNKYFRKFITMNMEGSEKTNAFGSCVIESKGENGKINLMVQNIRGNTKYIVQLVRANNGSSVGVTIGEFLSSDRGKGEMKCNVLSDGVCNSQIKLEDFDVVIIRIADTNELITPLVGYINEKIMWKNNFINFKKSNKTKEQIVSKPKELSKPEGKTINKTPEKITKSKKPNIDKIEKITSKPKELSKLEDKNINKTEKIIKSKKSDIDKTEKITSKPKELLKSKEQIVSKPKEIIKKEYEENTSKKENLDNNKKTGDTTYFIKSLEKLSEGLSEGDLTKNQNENQNNADDILNRVIEKDIKTDLDEELQINDAVLKEKEMFKIMVAKFKKEFEEISEITKTDEKIEERKSIYKPNVPEYNVENLFKTKKPIKPFRSQNKDVYWIYMNIEELAILPGNQYQHIKNPFFRNAYMKFGSFILGRYKEEDEYYYLIGVPDFYEKKCDEEIRNIGFIQFKNCEDKVLEEKDMGYWIMIVN